MPLPQGSKITIIKPDDFHAHFRAGDMMKAVLPYSVKQFGRSIAMPNIMPPVTTVEMAEKYFQEIQMAIPEGESFTPLMALYLAESLTPEEIRKAKQSEIVKAVKLYPKGATTNSDAGISSFESAFPVLEAMEEEGLPLLIHGEVVEKEVDIFDREKVFVETVLLPLVQKFPQLKIVLEHITTKFAVETVLKLPKTVAATITAHHLYINRNDILAGGIKPHYYCLPIAKREEDRKALIKAATSGSKKFFAGTDSAPHLKPAKECACGCAGIFTAHIATELYAQIFDQEDQLDSFEAFMSKNGADFYGLPYNQKAITLVKESQTVFDSIQVGGDLLVPFMAGKEIAWKII